MALFPPDLSFTPGEVGFGDTDKQGLPYDVLGRAEKGKQLSALVESISQPLVIALDGEWGSGKSHFLKLWTGAHVKENNGTARVIYFDAFEHDFLDDPPTSLIAKISAPPKDEPATTKAFNTVRTLGAKLALPAARLALAAATAGVSEVAGSVMNAMAAEAPNVVDAFWQEQEARRAAMGEFREALTDLTKVEDDKPRKLIFIVDELDRCRPDFALNLLEIIKHFFSVENVHFILGTNLDALESSVSARYGQGCDAAKYLQKFIHLTMTLPGEVGSGAQSTASLVYFHHVARRIGLNNVVTEVLARHLALVAKARKVSLRAIERITGQARLVPLLDRLSVSCQTIMLGTILLQALDRKKYLNLRNKTLDSVHILDLYGLIHTSSDDEGQTLTSIRDVWQAALNGKGTDEQFMGMFGRYRGDRKDVVESLLRDYLDTFQFTAP